MKKCSLKHIIGGSLLVSGTSVGAGMLALPVVSALGGFLYSLFVYLICCIVMTITGFFYLELSIDMPKNSNIISMSFKYLGQRGKIFSWIVYLFLFYCLLVAYVSGGGEIVNDIFPFLALKTSIFIFVIALGLFVYFGAFLVDKVNSLLMIGLIVSYLIFIYLGKNFVNIDLLSTKNISKAMMSFPLILIAFGYQSIIPSLTYYMKKDVPKIKLTILIGTILSLIIYVIWQFLILSIVPIEGKYGLKEAYHLQKSAIFSLRHYTNVDSFYLIGQFFSFFAITTSFLGVSLGLFDFLADGLRVKKTSKGKLLLAFLTFIPPLIITLINPKMFFIALNYAGGIGGVILLIFLPTLMVWLKRYKNKIFDNKVFGNKPIFISIFIFACFIICLQVLGKYLHFMS